MAFTLSSLDVHYLVKELTPLVEDAFVDKIYQGKDNKGEFLFRLRSPKHGKQQLFLKVPDAVFLTEHRYSWPLEPAGFCMQLRKHLSNTKLLSIKQHGFERIIELIFVKGDIKWTLIVELFSKGNVILVNSDGLIRGVMDLQRWKDRTLRVNAPYEYPPGERSTLSLSVDDISSLFKESSLSLVKFCAMSLSLGGKYAEELVARSGLVKELTELSSDDCIILHEKLQELFALPVAPVSFDDNAAPFALHAWPDAHKGESFSAVIESLVVAQKVTSIESSGEKVIAKAANKWQKIVDEQQNKLAGYEKASLDNKAKGEYIYEHYQDLQQLLTHLVSLHDKDGWSAVKAFIKEKKLPIVVDEKKGLLNLTVKE